MKRRMLLVGAALTAIAMVAAPAVAQDVSVCTFETQVEVTPGVSPTPGDGTFVTPEDGTITCTGAVEGTGTIGYEGVTGPLGQSCAADFAGSGTLHYVIGDHDVTGTFEFSRVAVGGGFNGDTTAGTIVGLFQFAPAEGQDCATTPVTNATVTGQAVLLGY